MSIDAPFEGLPATANPLQQGLRAILTDYLSARRDKLSKEHRLWPIWEALRSGLQRSDPVGKRPNLRVRGAMGQSGNFARVPAIAFLDSRETDTRQRGVFCVYLFRADMSGFYLILGQGVTHDLKEFGTAEGRRRLQATADRVRTLCGNLAQAGFALSNELDLRLDAGLAAEYRSGTIAHKFYPADAVPSDTELLKDLEAILAAYDRYLELAAGTVRQRVLKIAPGRDAMYWKDCLENGYICVGWDAVGDLRAFDSKEAFKEAFRQHYEARYHGNTAKLSAKANELWRLMELRPGDRVVANHGTSKVLAIGTVREPGYVWRPDREEYRHTVRVDWDTSFATEIPEQAYWATVTVAEVPPDLFALISGKASVTKMPTRDVAGSAKEGGIDYVAPSLDQIAQSISAKGLRIDDRSLRRYHLALRTRGFVILAGLSGSGKSWLAQEYARAVNAKLLLVPIAPNWNTNEDLLGYFNPLDGRYHDTDFSRFLREAADEYDRAIAERRNPQPYHAVLDEMNLARVEYYSAKFLSAMEVRARDEIATIELGPNERVIVPPNLFVIGTVNVDETTHGFADKVYDRAQLVELEVPRVALAEHLGDVAYADLLLKIRDALAEVAPFAFRVIDEIKAYIEEADGLGIPWEDALDEALLHKVLPKLKGGDARVGTALERVKDLTAGRLPMSHARVSIILDGFRQNGFASFF